MTEPMTAAQEAEWREWARLGSAAGEVSGEHLRALFASLDAARSPKELPDVSDV